MNQSRMMDKEEMLRRIQMRMNEATHLNNEAAKEELENEHQMRQVQKINKETAFKIPTYLLKRNSSVNDGPSSEDHIYDRDAAFYLREIRKIPQSVYQDYAERKKKGEIATEDYRPNPEVLSAFADRLVTKSEKRKLRNERAMNYDISGRYNVDFINDKNKRFNRKLAREYNTYTEDIRLNMERGGNV